MDPLGRRAILLASCRPRLERPALVARTHRRSDTASAQQPLAWHLTFSLLWVPLTIALWRLSAAWALLSLARYVVAHALTVTPVIFVHGGLLSLIAGRDRPKGWLLAEIVVYAAVAASGLAFVLHHRWRERHGAAATFEVDLAQARLAAARRAPSAAFPAQQPGCDRVTRPRRAPRRDLAADLRHARLAATSRRTTGSVSPGL